MDNFLVDLDQALDDLEQLEIQRKHFIPTKTHTHTSPILFVKILF
jgi:hypothetical protein